MKLSLIITAHNQRRYLQQLINLLEEYMIASPEVEIIVIDSSADETLLPGYISYYRVGNFGPSYARNFGVRKAKGEWILFCDADDLVNPHMIKTISGFDSLHLDAMFFDYKREEDKDILSAADNWYKHYTGSTFDAFDKIEVPAYFLKKFFPVHAVLFRKKIFEQVQFNEQQWFIEDVRFYLELSLQKGASIGYCRNPAFASFHRTFNNRQSLSSSNDKEYWKGVCHNYLYLYEHKKLSMGEKLQLVKLTIINYHVVSEELKPFIASECKKLLNLFFGLPRVLLLQWVYQSFYTLAKAVRVKAFLPVRQG